MALTPMTTAGTRLGGDLTAAEEALSRARSAAALVPGARVFTRITHTVGAKAAVDTLAAEWGATARWSADDTMYSAVKRLPAAELEAVWYRRENTRSGAAA